MTRACSMGRSSGLSTFLASCSASSPSPYTLRTFDMSRQGIQSALHGDVAYYQSEPIIDCIIRSESRSGEGFLAQPDIRAPLDDCCGRAIGARWRLLHHDHAVLLCHQCGVSVITIRYVIPCLTRNPPYIASGFLLSQERHG